MGLKKIYDNEEVNQVNATLVYAVCNIIQRGLSFLTIPIFARVLTQEEMGITTVYYSTMAVLIILTSLQLPYGSLNTAMVKFDNDRDGYISACNGIFTVCTIVYFAFYYLFKNQINGALDLPSSLFVLMGLEMLFSSSTACWTGKNRFELKYKRIAVVTLLQAFFVTVLSVAAVLVAKEGKGEIKVFVAGGVTVGIGAVIYFTNIFCGKKFFNKAYWKYAISFNIPLIPYYFSQMIFNQSDRLMIDRMCGRADAAKYGMAYTLGFILTIVLNAINSAYVPWFYEKIRENDFENNREVSFAISVLMGFLLLGVIAVGPEVIYIMGGASYMSAIWVIPPVAFSMLFLFYSQIFINVEFFFEEKYLLVIGSIASAVINIVLNYYCISRFGYIAAAYTTLVSFILFAVCNYYCMVYICKKKDIDKNVVDIKKMILLAVAFAICMVVLMALYNYFIYRYCLIITVLIIFVIFRNKVLSNIKKYASIFR